MFDDGARRGGIYVTLGQFTLVRLERDTQLLIPVYDYCVPQCQCECGSQEDSLRAVPQRGVPHERVLPRPTRWRRPVTITPPRARTTVPPAIERWTEVVRDAGQEPCETGHRGRRPYG